MLFYVAIILLPLLAAASNDVLFDTTGATPFYDNSCDDCYEAVNLNSTYGFFDEFYSTVYIGSNGFLTFDQGYRHPSAFVSTAFSPSIMLAPYWSDIDLGLIGNNAATISFEETQSNDLLEEAKRTIERRIFPGCGDRFEPTSLFIATWTNVPSFCDGFIYNDDAYDSYDYYWYDGQDYSLSSYADDSYDLYDYYGYDGQDYRTCSFSDVHYGNIYDSYDYYWYDDQGYSSRSSYSYMKRMVPQKRQLPAVLPLKENTFQVVLATDGYDTFAIINFEEIQWKRCSYENKMVFNAGDDVGFYMNPEVQLDDDTNVHQQGRWVYKINESKIRGPGCDIIST